MSSGLFESSRHKPVGSGADVCLAAPMALSKMSFILSCLGFVPFALMHESPCLAVISTIHDFTIIPRNPRVGVN